MTEIVKYQGPQTVVRTMDDAERAATAMAASGFFSDTKQAAQALVKVLAGQEMGFGPFASMVGVSIIQGKPSIGANLMAAAVKRSGRYDYRIIRLDDAGCELEFYEAGRPLGRSIFTEVDATRAGLLSKDNWKKFPRNMFFARAMSNGTRWYTPDVFGGTTAYTPDELGAIEDQDGHIIEMPTSQPVPVSAPSGDGGNGHDPEQIDPLQAAMDYVTPKGTRLGTATPEKRGELLDWANAQEHPDRETLKMKGHLETILEYLAKIERPATPAQPELVPQA